MNKNFMYGIGAVKYKDFTIGYIEKNSFDLGKYIFKKTTPI